MKKIFSIPLNPKLTEESFYKYVAFVKNYADYIYDIYFTCRIPPFMQDAMGDMFTDNEASQFMYDQAAYVVDQTGVKLSATFNNTLVRPTQPNLDLFVKKFAQIYNKDIISSITIPHTHWVATKQIQSAFPELEIKNTILRNVTEPREVVALGEAGFNYVNLDRDLMRDHDKLKEMKRAKEYAGVKLSLLANEGCLGNCPMMDEHYEFNNGRGWENLKILPQYFNDPISRVACPKWDYDDLSVQFKTADFPPWKEDWDELLEYVDVFKMHGRESEFKIWHTADIIKRYAEGQEFLTNTFENFIEDKNFTDAPINVWRKKIKTCRFECWDCHYCDKVWEAKNPDEKLDETIQLVTNTLVDSVNRPIDVNVQGLTSPRVLSIINELASKSNHYLEIGSYIGATASAALLNNNIKVTCVDSWGQQEIFPARDDLDMEFPPNDKDTFVANIKTVKGENDITVFDCDLFDANVEAVTDVDLFFYDGPHEQETTKKAFAYYASTLTDKCIAIFDDANHEGVIHGANEGIHEAGFDIVYHKMMLNEIEDYSQWWNGIYITVLQRK